MLARLLMLSLLLLCLPHNAAAVLVEFESTCNTDPPFVAGSTGNCALFELSDTDTVSGSFTYSDALFTPGTGVSLPDGEYDFLFVFGNQTFTDADNTLDLSFIVDSSGTAISSMSGVFVNAAGAQLSLLTSTTVRISLGSEGADTFGEGGVWSVTGPTAIPLPAAIWLFVSALLLSPLLIKRRRSELAN